jgi:hypothetical protein
MDIQALLQQIIGQAMQNQGGFTNGITPPATASVPGGGQMSPFYNLLAKIVHGGLLNGGGQTNMPGVGAAPQAPAPMPAPIHIPSPPTPPATAGFAPPGAAQGGAGGSPGITGSGSFNPSVPTGGQSAMPLWGGQGALGSLIR